MEADVHKFTGLELRMAVWSTWFKNPRTYKNSVLICVIYALSILRYVLLFRY